MITITVSLEILQRAESLLRFGADWLDNLDPHTGCGPEYCLFHDCMPNNGSRSEMREVAQKLQELIGQ